jgi:hypothetical protein
MVLVETDVSEERVNFIIRMKRISELATMLALASNQVHKANDSESHIPSSEPVISMLSPREERAII